jgi:arylsulfatase A-like enzyme/1-acyl-sn-glycerol-3-phosphate acyltransferase
MSARPGLLATSGIVVAYTLAFCVVLPVALFEAGAALDTHLGWRLPPSALGAVPAAWGAWLLAGGMRALWTVGGGWPITALPPPRLVMGGPYRVVRHPIYVGFDLLLLGAGLLVGSPGLAFVVAPLFLPVWMAYAALEERGLRRRFGGAWDRYAQRVGWLPRPSLRPVLLLLQALRVIRVRVEGGHHVPAHGPVVLVSNHTTYADPVWLAAAVPRRIWMATTAEAYRGPGVFRYLVRAWPTFPLRRYRADPAAARALLELLTAGEVVGLFVERERSVLGRYLGADPGVAAAIARLRVPVIPVALQGAYATGPRWAATLRIPTLRARIGAPLDFSTGAPAEVVDRGLRELLDEDPQRVWLEREPLDRLHRAVWRCPACLDEAGWRPAQLRCEACGAAATPSGDGRVRRSDGRVTTFAEWAEPVWGAAETLPLRARVRVRREVDPAGPLGPLTDEGEAELVLGPDGLRWAGHHLSPGEVRSTSTERADTLQVATADATWQFVSEAVSPFRLRLALDAVRGVPSPGAPAERPPVALARPSAPPRRRRFTGAAVGAGLAVAEGLLVVLPLCAMHGQAGLAAGTLSALLVYAGAGAALDLAAGLAGAPSAVAGLLTAAGIGLVAVATGHPPLAVAAFTLVAVGWAAVAVSDRFGGVALAVALWALSPALPRPAPARPALAPVRGDGPSIAVIVLDTVRADRTSLARADRDPTPHLAALAARGTTFARAYSPSCWSLPAHASILTGRLPRSHGAHFEHPRLDDHVSTLAEELRAAGWETAAFSANPLVAPGTGLGAGFTTFAERWRGPLAGEVTLLARAWHRLAAPPRDKGGAAVVEAVRAWRAGRSDDRPWFVLVNLFEAHAPYQEVPPEHRDAFGPPAPPGTLEAVGEVAHLAQVFGTPVPPELRERVLDLSDGAVHAADAYLGDVLAALSDADLVVVVSDHGEQHGTPEDAWGHDFGLSEPILRVPFVVAGPGVVAGRTVAEPVSLVDVAPTLRTVAGLAPGDGDGQDLSRVLAGAEAPADRVVRAEHWRTDPFTAGWWLGRPFGDLAAIRARRAAAVRGTTKRLVTGDGRDLGFDLAADPGELHPGPGAATGLSVTLPEAP